MPWTNANPAREILCRLIDWSCSRLKPWRTRSTLLSAAARFLGRKPLLRRWVACHLGHLCHLVRLSHCSVLDALRGHKRCCWPCLATEDHCHTCICEMLAAIFCIHPGDICHVARTCIHIDACCGPDATVMHFICTLSKQSSSCCMKANRVQQVLIFALSLSKGKIICHGQVPPGKMRRG